MDEVVFDEFVVEKGVIVNQLENCILAFHADAVVFTDESTTFQVFQYGGQFAVAAFLPQLRQFASGHACLFLAQQIDDFNVRLWMVEERGI